MSTEKQPIKTTTFKLAEHGYRRHTCLIDPTLVNEEADLTDPVLFQNVAAKINDGDEIRIVADDYSFVAYLFVTFVRGTDVVTRLMNFYELDDVDRSANPTNEKYEVKMRGPKKWSILNRETGEVVKENIQTQAEALRELDDYVRALKR